MYAGGVEKDGKTPKDTRTGCQKGTGEVCEGFSSRKFPDVRIIGHNELAAKACPSFDVQEWLKEIGIINNKTGWYGLERIYEHYPWRPGLVQWRPLAPLRATVRKAKPGRMKAEAGAEAMHR